MMTQNYISLSVHSLQSPRQEKSEIDSYAIALKYFYRLTVIHISLAKANHMAMSNFKETGKGLTITHPDRGESEIVVISKNYIHSPFTY